MYFQDNGCLCGMEPGGRQPAPGKLALVQAFVNTTDRIINQETLGNPEMLRAWLRSHDLLPGDEQLSGEDLEWALEVREALRNLLLAHTGEQSDPQAIEVLNRGMGRAQLQVRFQQNGAAYLEPGAQGLARALGTILLDAFAGMADGSWERLKVCRNEDCRWAFYDSSKNRSGAWCTMQVCGNRKKARTYRQRHQPVSDEQA